MIGILLGLFLGYLIARWIYVGTCRLKHIKNVRDFLLSKADEGDLEFFSKGISKVFDEYDKSFGWIEMFFCLWDSNPRHFPRSKKFYDMYGGNRMKF